MNKFVNFILTLLTALIIFGVMGFLGPGILTLCALSIAVDVTFTNVCGLLFGCAATIADIIGLVFIVKDLFNRFKTRKENYEQRLSKKNKTALTIYRKCVEKNVCEVDDESSIAALRIVAETYGITDIEKAKAAFEKGKEIENKILTAKEYAEIKKRKLDDEKLFNEQCNATKLVGKAKYAGKDTAKLDRIKDKLIDANNSEDKFAALNFSNFKYIVTEGKNVEFTCDGTCFKVFQLLGSPAALDGSIKICVLDETGKEIGCGYYSARGFNQLNLNSVGFEFRFTVKAMCIINEPQEKSVGKALSDKYSFDIKPLNLWLIEK